MIVKMLKSLFDVTNHLDHMASVRKVGEHTFNVSFYPIKRGMDVIAGRKPTAYDVNDKSNFWLSKKGIHHEPLDASKQIFVDLEPCSSYSVSLLDGVFRIKRVSVEV